MIQPLILLFFDGGGGKYRAPFPVLSPPPPQSIQIKNVLW